MSASSQLTAQQRRKRRLLLLLEPAVYAVLALVILFSATLHSSLEFDRTVLAVGFIAITIAGWFTAGKNPHLWGIAQRINNLGAAVALLQTGHTLDGLRITLIAWAAITSMLKIGALLQRRSPGVLFSDSKLATLLPIVLTCAMLLFNSDPIALIGLYGAYAIVWAVFGTIAAIDSVTAPDQAAADQAAA